MKRKILRLFVSALAVFMLSSCALPKVNWALKSRQAIAINSQVISEKELKLMALDTKCRFENYYETLYRNDFWEIQVSEDMSYEDYVREFFVFRELKAVLILNVLADERNITLTQEESEKLEEAAGAYYALLSDDEKAYTGASRNDVFSLLSRYFLAVKTEDELLSDKKAEISEEEGRVADIQIIRFSSLQRAEEIMERLERGESFLLLASEASESPGVSLSVAKGELTEGLDEVVFSMTNNDISGIIEDNGNYYIIRMENTYNLLQSVKNSENLLARKRFMLWEPEYSRIEGQYEILRDKDVWEDLSLSGTGEYTYHNLFSFLDR